MRQAASDPLTEEPCCSLAVEGEEQARLLAMFKAAAHPQRFEILKFLLTHPGCITGAIVDHVPLAQATVSQHLKVLREAGWIEGSVSGPATNYCLDQERIRWFRVMVAEIF